MINPLLEISWEDVRLLSVEGSEISITLKNETKRIKFETAKHLNDAFGEWCSTGKGQTFRDSALANARSTFPNL